MKKYKVSYYCGGANRSRKYFDNIHDALKFSIYGLRYSTDFIGLDLVD